MTIYICKTCPYETDRKSNYTNHNASKRHKMKILEESENITGEEEMENLDSSRKKIEKVVVKMDDEIDDNIGVYTNQDSNLQDGKYKCKKCSKVFNNKSNMYRHAREVCSRKLTEVEILINKVKSLEEKIKEQEIQKIIEENKKLKEEVKELKDDKNLLKKDKIESMSNIAFLKSYLTSCPSIDSIPSIMEEEEFAVGNDKFFTDLLYNHSKKRGAKYIASIVGQYYKNDKQEDQPIYTTDINRLIFALCRKLKKDKKGWEYDKKGKYIKDKILKPIMEHILSIIKEYRNRAFNFEDIDETRLITQKQVIGGHIEQQITNGIYIDDVLKELAPYFSIDTVKNKLLLK